MPLTLSHAYYLSLWILCFGRVYLFIVLILFYVFLRGFFLLVCMYVCMHVTNFSQNYWTELYEIFRDDLSSSKDQSIRFWERSGQRSRSKSWKGQKRIFVVMRTVFVRLIWNQRQNVHFSISDPLIWWQVWHWRRYVLYQVVCMYVCYQLFSKTTGPNYMKFSGMICHHPRTNWLDFGSNQVKGQGQGHKKVKNYKLHEIFRDDLSSSKDQSIRFWEQSVQRSRSQKGQKRIFVIACSVFVRFIWNQRQNVHFSIPYPLIWWQMWCWWRYALYRVPVLVML